MSREPVARRVDSRHRQTIEMSACDERHKRRARWPRAYRKAVRGAV